jgi:GNAT superfamily N-acetyltransferase
VDTDPDAVTLWRPTGPEELALVAASGWRAWPPRLAEQPIFYPVLNKEYATTIARDWNVRQSGSGYVTRFRVRRSFLDRYDVRQAGGRTILEYWIPAEDLAELNANLDEANKTAEFEPVGTHPDYRRRGLARAMLLHGMHRARASGATHMTVACLGAPGHPRARGLYYSAGFRELTRDVPLIKYTTAG